MTATTTDTTTSYPEKEGVEAMRVVLRTGRRIYRFAYPLGILTGIALTVLVGLLW